MDVDYIGFIYLWINKLNGKKYIGLHVGKEDDSYIGSGVHFKRAIIKHGIENFERKILYKEYESEQNLYKKEFEIINELNAVFDSQYYNLTNFDPKMVKFIDGKKERIISEETKEKMRKSRLVTKASQSTKDKFSRARKGKPSPTKGMKGLTSGKRNGQYGKKWYNNGITDMTFKEGEQPDGWVLGRIRGVFSGKDNPFYGKTHTEETKRASSIKNKGKNTGEANPAKRPEVRAKISKALLKAWESKKKGFANENC